MMKVVSFKLVYREPPTSINDYNNYYTSKVFILIMNTIYIYIFTVPVWVWSVLYNDDLHLGEPPDGNSVWAGHKCQQLLLLLIRELIEDFPKVPAASQNQHVIKTNEPRSWVSDWLTWWLGLQPWSHRSVCSLLESQSPTPEDKEETTNITHRKAETSR